MNGIWLATILGNILLALLLLWRGHYIRYSWLALSAILAVFADAYFWYCRNFHHALYMPSRTFIFFLWLGLNGMVIFEAFCWRNPSIQVPMELQVAGELALLLTQKFHFLWVAYFVDCGLRISNLLMICWFLYLFRKEPIYERRDSRRNTSGARSFD